MTRGRLVLGLLSAALLVGWLLLREGSREDPASGAATRQSPAQAEASRRPLLRGSGSAPDTGDVWLTVHVHENPGDQPAAHLWTEVLLRSASEPASGVSYVHQTDERGSIRIGPLRTREIEVRVGSRRHLPLDGWLTPRASGPQEIAVKAVLERGRSVAGRVLLPPGVPAAHARVTLELAELHLALLELDGAGGFEAHGLAVGPVAVVALAAHEGRSWIGRVDAQAGEDGITVALSEAQAGDAAMVRVRLAEAMDKPVLGTVELAVSSGETSQWQVSEVVPGEGLLLYAFRPGADLFLHVRPAHAAGLGEALVGPVRGTDVLVRLHPERRIEGTVVDEGGLPLAGATLTAAILPLLPAKVAVRTPRSVATDERGRFSLGALGPHAYRLEVVPPDGFIAPQARVVEAGAQDVRLVLMRGEVVRVRVASESGPAVAGAVVRLRGMEGEGRTLHEVATDAAGVATLTGVDVAATCRLEVLPPPDATDLLPTRRDAWRPAAEVIVLRRGYSISGTLRDPNGTPIRDAWVEARGVGMDRGGATPTRHADGSETWTPLGARTDRDGHFVAKHLEPGRYELRPHGGERGALIVEAGASGVQLVVAALTDLRIRLTGWQLGDRGAWALIHGTGQRGTIANPIGADGRVTFPRVDAEAEHELWVGGLPGGRYAWRKGLRAGGAEVEIPIVEGGSIRVRVVPPAGVSLDSWTVLTEPPLMAWPAAGTRTLVGSFLVERDDAAATFHVRGVPPGAWRITVLAEQGPRYFEAGVQASPGDTATATLEAVE